MASGYEDNPYRHEQGPADEDSDEIVNGLELAIEQIEEAMAEWVTVPTQYLPPAMLILREAVGTLNDTLGAYRKLVEPEPETKPGNECQRCTNWVNVEEGETICPACQQ